jgi:cell division septation protein DedD
VNSLIHREDDDELDDFSERPDREITLGTTTILALFFALAVVCAVFFGFGYSVGHRAVAPSAAAEFASSSGNPFAGFKPSAGNPLASASSPKPSGATVTIPVAPQDNTAPSPRPAQPTPTQEQTDNNPAEPTPITPVPRPILAPSNPPPVPVAAAPTPLASGNGPVVQIAAVSHQEDADLLVTTLKRRGYVVTVRSEPQDKFLHVQVGPFATHKDADAMRQRLLNDGFNAIVKDPGTH